MAIRLQLRGDTLANWTSVNPILASREFAVETDTLKVKVGDGVNTWSGLPYFTQGASGLSAYQVAVGDDPAGRGSERGGAHRRAFRGVPGPGDLRPVRGVRPG